MIWLLLLAVALSMAAQDFSGSAMVVAEARNLGQWAGILDAFNDFASRIGTIVTAGLYVAHGFGAWQTWAALAVTCITSYFATSRGTALAHRMLDRIGGSDA